MKLSTLDSLFLWLESPEIPAHVAGLQIYQLPKGKGSAWLQKLMAKLREYPPGSPRAGGGRRLRYRLPPAAHRAAEAG